MTTTTKTRAHAFTEVNRPAIASGRSRTHVATVIRAAYRPGSGSSIPATLTAVISIDPFGPNPSAHYQTYDIHPNGCTTLRTDSPYRTEQAAAAKFDSIHNEE